MSTFLVVTSGGSCAHGRALATYAARRTQALGHRVIRPTHGEEVTADAALVTAPTHDADAVVQVRRSGARAVLLLGSHRRDLAESAEHYRTELPSTPMVVCANPVAPQQVLHFDDGGFVVTSTAATALQRDVDRLVQLLSGDRATQPETRRTQPLPVTARRVSYGAPELADLLTDLRVEYSTRYAAETANTTLTEVSPTDFAAPHGTFVVLVRGERTLAGGAIRRLDEDTAEIKRVWTSSAVRRQGYGRRVIDELELAAADLGYTRIFLSTGPRQPEARALYLAAGYQPGFDLDAAPHSIGRHVFTKTLSPAPHGVA